MSNWDDLVGLPYIDGKQDCYQLVREYYGRLGLHLPNFARPNYFWRDKSLDLYAQYKEFGFQDVHDEPFQVGDGVLMPIQAVVNSHAGVVVEDNKILHHLPGRLSSVDPIRPKWIGRITVHLRHPDIFAALQKPIETVQLHEVVDAHLFRDPRFQKALAEQMDTNG